MSKSISENKQSNSVKYDPSRERRSLMKGLEHTNSLINFKNLDFFPFPEAGYINTDFAFSASQFFRFNKESDTPVMIRFNFDGVEGWQTDFTQEPIVYHRFNSGGKKQIKMQAKRGELFSEIVTREIYVRDGLRIGESTLADVCFSNDGQQLITLSSNRVKVLGIESGDTILIGGYEEDISILRISPKMDLIVTGAHHGTVKFWDKETGECKKIIKAHDGSIQALELSKDGELFISYGADGFLKAYHLELDTFLWQVPMQKELMKNLAISQDNSLFAVASDFKVIFTGDIQTGELTKKYEFDSSGTDRVVFNDKNEIIISIRNGNEGKVVNLTREKTLIRAGDGDQLLSFKLSSNGKFAIGFTKEQRVKVWDLDTEDLLSSFYSTDEWLFNDPFSTQQPLVTCRGWDNSIKLYNYQSGTCYAIFLMPEGYLKASDFHPHAPKIAVGGTDNTIKIWNLKNGQVESSYDSGYIWNRTLSFNETGELIAHTTDERTMQIWDVDQVQFKCTFEVPDDRIKQLSFISGKPWVFIRGQQSIHIYDYEQDMIIQGFEGNQKVIKSAIVSDDGKYIVSCGVDFTIKLWDLEQGYIVKELVGLPEYSSEISFTGDKSKVMAKTENGFFIVWSMNSGKALWSIDSIAKKVSSFAVSPDNLILATGVKNELCLWSMATGNMLDIVGYHQHTITGLQFHPTKPILFTGSLDNTTKVWDLESKQLLKSIRGGNNVKLSADGKYLLNGFGGELRIWNIQNELRIQL